MSQSSSPNSHRLRSAAFVSLVATAVLLVVGAPAQARRKDQVPPTFAGLKSATTCIPGPIREGTTSSYHLTWEAATDNVTPSKKIVYNVYQATAAGGENFAQATYTTAAGVTSFDTPQLATGKTYYFVVRARDQAGNEDSNKIEREGQNLCV
jgi:hypothetical protein